MALPTDIATGTWTLDGSHSTVGFTVRHAGISKVRGEFKEVDATLDLAANFADSAIKATIKAASFDSGDAIAGAGAAPSRAEPYSAGDAGQPRYT